MWAVAALAFALLRIPYVSVPLERDEGEYAYIAQRSTHGEVPYRDAFDQKPPGVFLAYRGAFALFGQSIEGIHLFLYAWTALTAGALFALVRRLAGGLAGAFAVLVFSIASTDPRIGGTAANTEAFMLLPLVGAVYCMLRGLESGRAGWWLACGALSAGACWFKQVAVTNAVFVAAFAAVELARREGAAARSVLRVAVWLGAGAAALSAPPLLYFAVQGAWQPFLDAVVVHNLAYTRSFPLSEGLRVLWLRLGEQAPGFAVFWMLGLSTLAVPRLAPLRTRALLGAWLLAALVGVSTGLYFRNHYFVQLLPALAACCGVSLSALASRLVARPSAVRAWLGAALLLALLVGPPVWASRATLWADSPEAISREIYGLNPFPESLGIADYIRRTSGPDDRVLIVGSEPQILFYAERRSATRYIFFYPLTGGFADALERQRESFAEVVASRPLYIVWVNLPTSLGATEASEPYLFDAISELLREYRVEFVARPDRRNAGFEFVYGALARHLLEAAKEDTSLPWIVVYRRGIAPIG